MNDGPVTFTVFGVAKPQGSMRHVGRGILVAQGGQEFKDWRTDMTLAAVNAMSGRLPLNGPVQVNATFAMRKTGSARKTDIWHSKRPDLDKLTRALLDALQNAGVVHDDSQVARLEVSKTYPGVFIASPALPGVRVDVLPLSAQ